MNYYLNIKNIIIVLLLSSAYILLGIFSIKYVTMSSGIAIAWLPNSLLLAFFLIKDIKEWKYYIPFFIGAEIVADYSSFTIVQALQFSFINLFETTVSAYYIKKLSGNEKINFMSTKYVLVFSFIGLIIMPSLSAIFGATVYYTQIGTEATFFEFWRIWFFGDSIGIILLTPIMILLKENYQTLKNYNFNLPDITILIATIYLALMLFSTDNINLTLPATPLIFTLLLLWIVYRQGLLPGLILSIVIIIIAINYTSSNIGPFSIFEVKETTIYLQEFIALLIIITLFFGVLHKEINDSKEKLEYLNKTLEEKVNEKTKSLVELNKKLQKLASTDPLTNIYNRRMINEYLAQETTKAKRYKDDLSLIMIDIDHFKKVNDTYGHQVGDEILIKLVEIISSNIRKVDIFGRWGGEEFIILLPQTNLEQACIVAENIRKLVAQYTFDKVGQKTISLGVSQFNENEEANNFIKRTDDALYKAKNSGRNKIVSA